jgi:hypothetical protein
MKLVEGVKNVVSRSTLAPTFRLLIIPIRLANEDLQSDNKANNSLTPTPTIIILLSTYYRQIVEFSSEL